jgi:calcineurin-like phosphoesterase
MGAIIQRFLSSRPVLFPIARGPVKLHGAMIDIDETTGKALRIERVAHLVEEAPAPEPKPAPVAQTAG